MWWRLSTGDGRKIHSVLSADGLQKTKKDISSRVFTTTAPTAEQEWTVNDVGKFIKLVLYYGLAVSFLLAGLGNENELVCCVAGLLAIAGELATKDGGKDND